MHLDPMIFDEHSLRNLEVLYSKNTTFGILYSPLTKQHFPLYYARKLIWNHFCLYQDSNPAWWLRSTNAITSLPPWIYLYMIFKDLLIQTNLPTTIFSMSDDFGSKKPNLCRPNSWQLLWAAKRSKSRSASLASTDGRTDASQSFFAFVSFSPHLTWSIILADAGGAEEEKESSTPTVSMTLNSCLEEEGGIEIAVWSVLEFEVLF